MGGSIASLWGEIWEEEGLVPKIPERQKGGVNLLALDVATVTGFCTRTASGTWNLTPKKDESKGMRLIRFRSKLKDITQLEDIKLIVFEDIPIYGKHPNTVGIEMIGVLKLFCEDSGIEYKSYPATVIKKFGGKGNASKEQMVEFARRYKKDVTSHDEADAILLYHCAKEDLQI